MVRTALQVARPPPTEASVQPAPQSYVVTVEVVVEADNVDQAMRLVTSELEAFKIMSATGGTA